MINYTGYTENYHDGFDPWFVKGRKKSGGAPPDMNHSWRVYPASGGYVVRPGLIYYPDPTTGVNTLVSPMYVGASSMSFNHLSNYLANTSSGLIYFEYNVTDTATDLVAGTLTIDNVYIKKYTGSIGSFPVDTKGVRRRYLALVDGPSILQYVAYTVRITSTWIPVSGNAGASWNVF